MAVQLTYTLRNGRTWQAVREDTGYILNGAPWFLVFIKEGERHVPLDEQARLAFDDDALSAWLKCWRA